MREKTEGTKSEERGQGVLGPGGGLHSQLLEAWGERQVQWHMVVARSPETSQTRERAGVRAHTVLDSSILGCLDA